MTLDDLCGETKDEVETYYWFHGRLPKDPSDLSDQWRSLCMDYPAFERLSISWHVVKAKGYDRTAPTDALIHMEIRDRDSGEVLYAGDDDWGLARKGSKWAIRYWRPRLGVHVPIDEPYNIACCFALAMVQNYRYTGKWQRGEVLLRNGNPWFGKHFPLTATVSSFTSRIEDRGGKKLLVLSCSADGNDYVFDPSGFDDDKAPVVRPSARSR